MSLTTTSNLAHQQQACIRRERPGVGDELYSSRRTTDTVSLPRLTIARSYTYSSHRLTTRASPAAGGNVLVVC